VTAERRANIKVLLVGPYPPPYGGISATIHDIRQFLLTQQSVEVQVLNIGEGRAIPSEHYVASRGLLELFRTLVHFVQKQYLVHLETNGHNEKSWLMAFLCAVVGIVNGRKTIIAFGSGMLPEYLKHCAMFHRLVARVTVMVAGCLICRNDEMVAALKAVGCAPQKIMVVPGFVGFIEQSPHALPDEVVKFLREHDPVLGAAVTASPEYGIPLALKALNGIRHVYGQVGLVLFGVGHEVEASFPDLVPVREHVLFAGALPPSVARGVISQLSIFLRPTYFDGDSVSVREALALGIPVVASATGMRPASVVTFRVGDSDDFREKVLQVLSRVSVGDATIAIREEDRGSAMALLGLYERMQRQ